MALVQIDAKHVQGEPGTGYESGAKGSFRCDNCEYFTAPDECGQETMKERSKLPRKPNGSVEVDPDGCCEYVDRLGEKKSSRMAGAFRKSQE